MDIQKLRDLLTAHEEIEAQIRELAGGTTTPRERKAQTCSNCGDSSHNARACPSKKSDVVRLFEKGKEV